MDEVMLLEDGENGKKNYKILYRKTLDDVNYLVGYPVDANSGEVEIFKENSSHEFVHVDEMDIIIKVYEDFKANSNNVKFVDADKAIHKGEEIEFEGKKYVCFETIEFEGTIYVYLITATNPAEVKFAKEVFDDTNELKLELIGDFYEKEKALSLLQKSELGSPEEREEE